MDALPTEQMNSPFQPKQSFFDKVKAHKTAVILGSVGFVLLLTMTLYLISPLRNALIAPATNENLIIPTLIPIKKAPSVTPKETLTPTPNPKVLSWRTYANSTYKYNIKYPPDWTARNLGSLEPKIPSYVVFNSPKASASARNITISVSTRTYAEQLALGSSSSAVTVAGINGTKQYFKDSDGNTSTIITLPRTNNLLVLRAKTAYLSTFNLMLSTLKITQ